MDMLALGALGCDALSTCHYSLFTIIRIMKTLI